MYPIILRLVNQSRFHHVGKSVNSQVHGWTRCLLSRQYSHVQRQHNLLGKKLKCSCYSSVGQGGGESNNPFLKKIGIILDRLRSRWLYFRYEGSFGPPESISVKQKRKLRFQSLSLSFILLIIIIIGNNFNPQNKNPVFFGVKLWPDNIEEYRDILDATSVKSPLRSSSSSPPPTKTTTS